MTNITTHPIECLFSNLEIDIATRHPRAVPTGIARRFEAGRQALWARAHVDTSLFVDVANPVRGSGHGDFDTPVLFQSSSRGGHFSSRGVFAATTGAIHTTGGGQRWIGWGSDNNRRDRGALDRVEFLVRGSDDSWSRLAYTRQELEAAAAAATWADAESIGDSARSEAVACLVADWSPDVLAKRTFHRWSLDVAVGAKESSRPPAQPMAPDDLEQRSRVWVRRVIRSEELDLDPEPEPEPVPEPELEPVEPENWEDYYVPR